MPQAAPAADVHPRDPWAVSSPETDWAITLRDQRITENAARMVDSRAMPIVTRVAGYEDPVITIRAGTGVLR